MAIIALEGMQFYAHHGYYEEEQIIGNQFVVDIYMDVNIQKAAMHDEFYEPAAEDSDDDEKPLSVNYETVHLLCKTEMQQKSKLLENVAQRIADRIDGYFENLRGTRVRVRKLAPPLSGKVASTYVEVQTGVFLLPTAKSLSKLQRMIKDWGEYRDLDTK